ncbi:PD-(D/E)XK nuclease family protein [Candidatus Daviesbacteria bacterium]|nr:PD-(D/E)XK nuclease family protein [Candidatus Daviesbacteria bacterium]
MPFNDGIDRKFCFSLTDFREFEYCPFRFFVLHHFGLGKKYELAEGNFNMALGSLLDETIKLFHQTNSYNQPPEYVANLIKASLNKMLDKVAKSSSPTFYSAIKYFLDDNLCKKASEIFIEYYNALNGHIKKSIEPVGFCEWIIEGEDGKWKLWGGPDAIEMGDDGIPEICDYKYREDVEKGKENLDMDLMPKLYTLLCCKRLIDLGYKKARFIVRLWLEPKNNDLYEEFDLDKVFQFEEIFKQKIAKIISTTKLSFCNKSFCKICNSNKKGEFLRELESKKIIQMDENLLFSPV